MKKHKVGRNPQAFARKSLRAVGMGYLGLAMREPGMFRTAFSVPPPLHSPDPSNTGSMPSIIDGGEIILPNYAGGVLVLLQ